MSTKKIVDNAFPSIYGYFTGPDNSHHELDAERASGSALLGTAHLA